MPCEYPEHNVRMIRRKAVNHFFVPINHKNAHNMGYQDLIEAVERAKLFELSTRFNNTVWTPSEGTDIKPVNARSEKESAGKVETESFCDFAAAERAETISSARFQS